MILEYFTLQPKAFRPSNIDQYTVFQIAKRLHAEFHLKDYLLIAERHSSARFIKAYRAAIRADKKHETFLEFLNH